MELFCGGNDGGRKIFLDIEVLVFYNNFNGYRGWDDVIRKCRMF